MAFFKKLRKNKRLYNFVSLLLIYLTLILVLLVSSKIISILQINNPNRNNSVLNNNLNTNFNSYMKPVVSKIKSPNLNYDKSNISLTKNLYNNFPLDSQDIVSQVKELPVPLNNIYDIDYNI